MDEPTEPQSTRPKMIEHLDQVQPSALPSTPPASVWPPLPVGSPPQGVSVPLAYPFQPVRQIGTVVMILLAVHALLSVFGLATAWNKSGAANEPMSDILAGGQGFLVLVTGLCFLIRTYRVSANLRFFMVDGVSTAPGWAVGYFFVPVMNLYRLYQVFREIWQASDPGPAARDGQAWQNLRVPALLGLWWAFWLLSSVVDTLAAKTPHEAVGNVAASALGLVAALLALLVVRGLTDRQENTARHLRRAA